MQAYKQAIIDALANDSQFKALTGATADDPRLYWYYQGDAVVSAEKPAYVTYALTASPEQTQALKNPSFTFVIWGKDATVVEAVRDRLVALFDNESALLLSGESWPQGGSVLPVTSGLKLHLKADAITGVADGGAVATWPDSSGNAFDATEATNQPTYKTGIVNGRPIVRFDGTDDRLIIATGFNATTKAVSGITVIGVYKTAVSDATRRVLGIQQGTGTLLRHAFGITSSSEGLANANPVDAGTAVAAASSGDAVPVGRVVIQSSVADYAAALSIWINGIAGQSLAIPGTPGLSSATDSLGAAVGFNGGISSQFFNGDIAEIVVYNRALTSAERLQVEGYLATKYNISPNVVVPRYLWGTLVNEADQYQHQPKFAGRNMVFRFGALSLR